MTASLNVCFKYRVYREGTVSGYWGQFPIFVLPGKPVKYLFEKIQVFLSKKVKLAHNTVDLIRIFHIPVKKFQRADIKIIAYFKKS